jgi:hypothetical protein
MAVKNASVAMGVVCGGLGGLTGKILDYGQGSLAEGKKEEKVQFSLPGNVMLGCASKYSLSLDF